MQAKRKTLMRKTISHAAIHQEEKMELVHSGKDYFSRLRNIISHAKSEIHLQTYIFENDSTGLKITKALTEAANRKVKVYVLLNGYGPAKLSKPKLIMQNR